MQPISFARGAPSLDIVDIAGLKAAAARAFDEDPAAVAGYGPGAGYPPLREWIAKRYGVKAEQVLITNGSLQADAFIFEHLVNPGDEVVVEKPTYDRTLLGLTNLGAKVTQVSLDSDGLVTSELRELLESGLRPKLAHVIPNFQNPAGVTLSEPRRRELIELAGQYSFTIFEDDPYVDIRFRGEALPSMLSLDDPAHPTVIAAGSFTKTICPGVRCGYLIGPADVIAAITAKAVNTYISPNMLSEVTVYQFVAGGAMESAVATVKSALQERSSKLAAALRREIPEATFTEPDGGYFLWIDLPDDVDVAKLAPAANGRGVAVVKGTDFLLEGGEHSLRLAYSAVTVDQIDEGVHRLAAAIADVRG